MENFETTADFEYYFLNNGKYQINSFEHKFYILDIRFKDYKFKKIETLIKQFNKKKLSGHPSNTGVNGWAKHSIEINFLDIVWISNFSYEDTTMGFSPLVNIYFKEKIIKTFNDINTTKKFVKILNDYINPSDVIKLIESEYGIEKCYKKIMQGSNEMEVLKIFFL
jgi:hypothetical protein